MVGRVRSVLTGFLTTAAGFVLMASTACSAAPDAGDTKEVESQAQQAYIASSTNALTPPVCTRDNTKWVKAQAHTAASGEVGYTRPFPNHTGDATIDNYESKVWGIPHGNGYEYKVDNVFWSGSCNVTYYSPGCGTTAYVYLIGILDQNASPAYDMSAPPVPAVRTPWNTVGPFSATSYDYNTEVTLATNSTTAAPGHLPLNSSQGRCVGILDENGNFLNYFAEVDIHDPTGVAW